MDTIPQRREMPIEIADIFHRISNEVVWIQATQISYKQLFAADQAEVDLVITKLGSFARLLERSMKHNVILSLCRLVDPPETRIRGEVYPNLVLQQLVRNLPAINADDIAFQQSIQDAINEIRVKCVPFQALRNQILAHNDLQTLLGSTIRPLPPTSLHMLDEAILKVCNVMNRINSRLSGSHTMYDHIIMHGEAKDLVFFLQEAQKYENQERDERYRRATGKEPD